MKIVRQISGLRKHQRPVCLAVGFFDGLHLGHQEVLRRTQTYARSLGGEAWAMTFDPHPLKVLAPDAAPQILTDTAHKLSLLRQFGMDGCLLIPFNRRFAAIPAETFLTRLERDIPRLRCIFMGHDWRFGRNGTGDFALLAAWARGRGIVVKRVPAVRRAGIPVSSTRIRKAVSAGDLTGATTLLGRPFSILGTVVPGNRIGRKLGYPTANLDPHNEVSPPTGVYAVQAIVGQTAYPGLVNFGHHPSVKYVPSPLFELHLLDTRLSLYGRGIEVFFLRRLRPEKRFPDLDSLVAQIRRDEQSARRLLGGERLKNLWIRTLQRWRPDTIVPPKQTREKREKKGNRAQVQYGS